MIAGLSSTYKQTIYIIDKIPSIETKIKRLPFLRVLRVFFLESSLEAGELSSMEASLLTNKSVFSSGDSAADFFFALAVALLVLDDLVVFFSP